MWEVEFEAQLAHGGGGTPESGFALAAVYAGLGVGTDQFMATGAENGGHRLDPQVFVDFCLVGVDLVVADLIDEDGAPSHLRFH